MHSRNKTKVPSSRAAILSDPKCKPPVKPVDRDVIPQRLKRLDRWLGWKWKWNPKVNHGKGKWEKPPINARTGGPGSSIDPKTWCSVDEAVAAVQAKRCDAIGFALGETDDGTHIAGVDLDDCRDPETGELNPLAQDIIGSMDTYCEVSPSGTGVKLFCIGQLLDGARHKNKAGTVEIYGTGRYFTVTGEHVDGTPQCVNRRQKQLTAVHKKYIGVKQRTRKRLSTKVSAGVSVNGEVKIKALEAMLLIKPPKIENDGSKRLLMVARETVRYDLDKATALSTICAYTSLFPFPKRYTKEEILQRVQDTEKQTERGSAIATASPLEVYRPFPAEVLPGPLRELVKFGAKAIGCDPAFVALPAITVCMAAIGGSRVVRLKRSWVEPSIVWTAIVGLSGTGKSPAAELAMKPLHTLQERAFEEHAHKTEEYKEALKQYDRAKAEWEQSHQGDPPNKPEKPIATRYIVGDVTVEGLIPLLADNPRGLLLFRDELSGWTASFDRYATRGGRSSADAAHWLSIHGARSVTIDRKTGEHRTVYVPHARVCVAGGIQPEVLKRALGDEHRENGLAARLLLAYPPLLPKYWTDAELSAEVENAYFNVVVKLLKLQPESTKEGELEPVAVDLSSAARKLFTDFYNANSEEAADLGGDLASALWKLECYAARLALFIHCSRHAAGEAVSEEINESSMRSALELVAWFKHEAKRVYALLEENAEEAACRQLVDWIAAHGGRVTVREVQQGNRRFATSDEAKAALSELVAAGIGHWQNSVLTHKGGRPTHFFVLNAVSTSTKPP